MHFILAPGCIEQFDKLRSDYQAERGSLDTAPSFFTMPTSLGGINYQERKKQIVFLEQLKMLLQDYLIHDDAIKTAEQWKANLMASRIMIAACLYVQSEIGSSKENSILYKLINRYLGVNSKNFMDEKDKEECIHTAFNLSNQPNFFDEIKSMLAKKGYKSTLEEKWIKFAIFLGESTKQFHAKNHYNKFPVTTFIQPVFGAAFSYVGSSVGWIAAEAFSSSSTTQAPRQQLTAAVGGTLMLLGPVTALWAPSIASRLFSTLCAVSITTASERAMGFIGKGVGTLVALPFDLAYNLLRAIGSLMINYVTPVYDMAQIDGVRVADGALVVQGLPLEFKWMSPGELNSHSHAQRLEIKNGNLLLLNGQEVDISPEIEESLKRIQEVSCAQIEEVIESEMPHADPDNLPVEQSMGL